MECYCANIQCGCPNIWPEVLQYDSAWFEKSDLFTTQLGVRPSISISPYDGYLFDLGCSSWNCCIQCVWGVSHGQKNLFTIAVASSSSKCNWSYELSNSETDFPKALHSVYEEFHTWKKSRLFTNAKFAAAGSSSKMQFKLWAFKLQKCIVETDYHK